jgi:hypothetical protein
MRMGLWNDMHREAISDDDDEDGCGLLETWHNETSISSRHTQEAQAEVSEWNGRHGVDSYRGVINCSKKRRTRISKSTNMSTG